jgi:hypothetical protein
MQLNRREEKESKIRRSEYLQKTRRVSFPSNSFHIPVFQITDCDSGKYENGNAERENGNAMQRRVPTDLLSNPVDLCTYAHGMDNM